MDEVAGACLEDLLVRARKESRDVLLEHEGYALMKALGLRVPKHLILENVSELVPGDLDRFATDRLVLKVVSPEVLHKSDVDGVLFLPRDFDRIKAALEQLQVRFESANVACYLLSEFVPFDRSLGGELLLGLRQTQGFGPVVTFGPGGVYTEFLSANFRSGHSVALIDPHSKDADRLLAGRADPLQRAAVTACVTGRLRGQAARVTENELARTVSAFLQLAKSPACAQIAEIECNPIVLTEQGPFVLDVLIKLTSECGRAIRPELSSPFVGENHPRPTKKIRALLEPASIGIIGVSEKMNPGRIILENTLKEGFDPNRIYVVKAGSERISGCACVPDIRSLPERVDLFILSISATQTPAIIEELIDAQRAESMIVIAGGLEEHAGSERLVREMHSTIRASRETDWRGPVINGGNCLGIRSRPGRYDTLFIPRYKLPQCRQEVAPVALLSQSGAFAVAQASKLAAVNPKYLITFGNQTDLTVGDYLQFLEADDGLRVFACYIEGFKNGDGRRWLEAARKITANGRRVVLYASGRNPAGAEASVSHTASVAGDYEVTRQLAESAGVLVAETLADFEDLLLLCALLEGRSLAGPRLGMISNAGFECVAMADNLGPFSPAQFSVETEETLADGFSASHLENIVSVHNPVDLTPIMNDELYGSAVEALLRDPGVDAAVIGCVPLTAALATLPKGSGHGEDFTKGGGLATRLLSLFRAQGKPFVVVVDSGSMYDAFAQWFEDHGMPCFRSADRAMRLFGRWAKG